METLNYNPTPRFKDGDSIEQVLDKINKNFQGVYTGMDYELAQLSWIYETLSGEAANGMTKAELLEAIADEVEVLPWATLSAFRIGVAAHLSTASDTVVALGFEDTFLPIAGAFTNSPMVGFDVTETPSLQYKMPTPFYFEIDLHSSFSSDLANTTVNIGIKKNGAIVDQSIIQGFLKNIGQAYNLSLTAVVQLEQDDEIQLVVSADEVCTLTFYNVNTTIRPFKL